VRAVTNLTRSIMRVNQLSFVIVGFCASLIALLGKKILLQKHLMCSSNISPKKKISLL
jgi:hypothetical protein